MLFTLQSSLFELLRDRVNHYHFTLDALTLKPSDFCSIGVSEDRPDVYIRYQEVIPEESLSRLVIPEQSGIQGF